MRKGSLRAVAALVPRTPRAWDVVGVLVTAVLFTIAWPTLFLTHDVPDSLAPAVAAAGVGPLLLIRIQPFAGWLMAAAVALIVGVGFQPSPDYAFPWHVTHFLVLLALLFAVALIAPMREVLTAWLGTMTLFLLVLPWDLKAGWVFGVTMATVIALLLRWLVLSQRELARQEEVSELERARRAVLEERSRIARDLHDVVAHSMSMVVVQAQSAPQRLGAVSPEVQQEFSAISDQARTALNEVRGMLGVLRSDGQLAEDVPQPGLPDIDSLLGNARAAGMDLAWSVSGEPAGCSDASAMVVVRLLQEALANASRHAPGADVHADIEYDAASVQIVVRNSAGRSGDPSTTRALPPVVSSGHDGTGLAGMRARVEALGGHLTARPTPNGSFEVRASIPKVATGNFGAVT